MNPPSESEVLPEIRAFVEREFLYMRPGFVLKDDESLLKTGVVDSMGVLEVIEFLERQFGVRPLDDEITEANLGSLRAIAGFVVARRR